MTKKDYILIADVIRSCVACCATGAYDIAENLAYALVRDNPQFDKKRFITACGFSEKGKTNEQPT